MQIYNGAPDVDNVSNILEAMVDQNCVKIEELARSQLSASLLQKLAHTEQLLRAGTAQWNTPDPIPVQPESSELVTAVLWRYTSLENAFKAYDASGATAFGSFQRLITALLWGCDQCDIRANWNCMSEGWNDLCNG